MSSQVRLVVDAIGELLDRVTKSIVTGVVNKLQDDPRIGGTPIDTGFASSNWIANVGAPFSNLAGSRQDAENGFLSNLSAQRLQEVTAAKKLFNGPVHVTNNVDYITLLNSGSSKQAPSGFVQAAIASTISGLGRKL